MNIENRTIRFTSTVIWQDLFGDLLEDLLVGENQILEGKTTRWEDEQKKTV